MKKTFAKLLAGLLLFSMLGGSAWAQGRIATIDLRKVFDNYWKKKQAEAQLKERQADMEAEDKKLLQEFDKAKDEYQALMKLIDDQAVSSEERDKRKKQAEDKLKQLQELQVNIRQYENTAKASYLEQTDRMRSNILTDIRNVVNAKAKTSSYSMVLDTAAETINKTPVFLYTTGENDITDAVLLQLNSNAPAELPKTEEKPLIQEKKKENKK